MVVERRETAPPLRTAKAALEAPAPSIAKKTTSRTECTFLEELLEQKPAPETAREKIFRSFPSDDTGGDGARSGDAKDDMQSEEEDEEGRGHENNTRVEEEEEHVE